VRRVARGAVLAGVLALGTGCEGRAKVEGASEKESHARSGPSVAVLDLTGGAPEQDAGGFLGVSSRRGSFDRLVRVIVDLDKDKDVKAVLVRFGGASLGIARAQEIGDLLEGVRKTNKPVYCHADGYSNATMLTAARGCSRIYVSPAGGVEAIGIAAQLVYLRKLLADELHMTIDILQVGKFKGAEEPLTRDGPSDEARASLEGVLADMRASWLAGLKKGRGHDEVGDAAEDGPYSPKKAKERGLIDEVGYADEALNALKKESAAVREDVKFGSGAGDDKPDDLGDVLRVLAGSQGGGAPVALIRASGSIAMSGGGGILGGRSGITEKELTKLLVRVEKDDDVKVVVLRIDSPGGSALASDLLWHQLMKVRAKKPIVVSVGEMAASGGYYLSCAGNVIFAEPTSIVGSIGVVGGKIAFGRTLESIGVHAETFPAKRGDAAAANRAAYLSPLLGWDDATKARVLETMTGIYDLFLARIAEGRKTTTDKIAPFAEGRIFSGRQAKENGLVDELGGLNDALVRAREIAKLPADAKVSVLQQRSGLLEALEGGGGDDEASAAAAAAVGREAQRVAGLDPVGVLERVAPELVPFATSIAALGEGERALVALPFAVVVR
jgi:protease-4